MIRPLLLSFYFIAVKENRGDVLGSLDQFAPLMPPAGRYYADPFLIENRGVQYLFFEDFDYKKGVISYVLIEEAGRFSAAQVALELPVHLSFPSFYQEGEEIYMIPETYSSQSISLFKAVAFPERWEWQRTLVRGDKFSDPILFHYDGYYWIFAAVDRDRLVVFYASALDGPYFPHPINQKRIRGRNAGNIYCDEGRLVRPTMDCRIRYGRAMVLKEIVLLNPTEFIEKAVGWIEPDWAPGLVGTHTYSRNRKYVAYDGQLD